MTMHRCAVANDLAAARRTRAGTAATSRQDSTSVVEPLGVSRSLFFFWVENFDTRIEGERLDVANTAIRVGSSPTALGGLD